MNETESKLLDAVTKAHAKAVFRNNASSALLSALAESSGDFGKALIGALCSFGARHAPLEQTAALLSAEDPAAIAEELLSSGKKVPGWGSSFFKNAEDPAWSEVRQLIEEHYPVTAKKIEAVQKALNGYGKNVLPNPSCYTAATALALSLPPTLTVWLLIRARLDGWASLFARHCG